MWDELSKEEYGGVLVQYVGRPLTGTRELNRAARLKVPMKVLEVCWMTELMEVTSLKEFLAYGNQASVGYCLIARVGLPARRTEP